MSEQLRKITINKFNKGLKTVLGLTLACVGLACILFPLVSESGPAILFYGFGGLLIVFAVFVNLEKWDFTVDAEKGTVTERKGYLFSFKSKEFKLLDFSTVTVSLSIRGEGNEMKCYPVTLVGPDKALELWMTRSLQKALDIAKIIADMTSLNMVDKTQEQVQ